MARVHNKEDVDNAYGGLSWLQDALNGLCGPEARDKAIEVCKDMGVKLSELAQAYWAEARNDS